MTTIAYRPRKPPAPSRYAPDPRPHPQAAYAERQRAARMARNVVSPPPEVVAMLLASNAAPRCAQCMQHVYAPGHVCTVVDARGEALFRVPAPEPLEARVRVGWTECSSIRGQWLRGGYRVRPHSSAASVWVAEAATATVAHYERHPSRDAAMDAIEALLSRAPAQPARGWRDATTAEEALRLAGFDNHGKPEGCWWYGGKICTTTSAAIWQADAKHWYSARAGYGGRGYHGAPLLLDLRAAIAHALGEDAP